MKKTICVDLDGVLAEYDGWKGVKHIGNPIPGAVTFVAQLAQKYEVVIHTVRTSPLTNPGFTLVELLDSVKEWLDMHLFTYHSVWVGEGKPIAVAYVDDKGVMCCPQKNKRAFEDALNCIESLE